MNTFGSNIFFCQYPFLYNTAYPESILIWHKCIAIADRAVVTFVKEFQFD